MEFNKSPRKICIYLLKFDKIVRNNWEYKYQYLFGVSMKYKVYI